MFDINKYVAEFEKTCSICNVNTITLFYTTTDVSSEDIENHLILNEWLDTSSIDDMFWGVYRCEFCRKHALIV